MRSAGPAPLVDQLVGHDRGRHGRVEAVGLAEHRHFHQYIAFPFISLGQARLLVADEDEGGLAVARLLIVLAGGL